jgi:hypothetical protein
VSDSPKVRQHVVELECGTWPEGVTSAVLTATRSLGQAELPSTVTLVVPRPPKDPAHRACLTEALRGVIHSSTLEQPTIRTNLIVGGSDSDRQEAVSYVSAATFVFGATIDLGQTP